MPRELRAAFWCFGTKECELIKMEVGLFSVSCLFRNCADGYRWMFSGVYGPIIEGRT